MLQRIFGMIHKPPGDYEPTVQEAGMDARARRDEAQRRAMRARMERNQEVLDKWRAIVEAMGQ